MKDDNQDLLLDSIVGLIEEGVYTKDEAEELFKIKLDQNIYRHKKNGFYIKTKSGLIPDYNGWSDYIKENYNFFTSNSGDYIYDKDIYHYRNITEIELFSILDQTTCGKALPNHYTNFIKALRGKSFRNDNFFNKNHKLINLKNGILNVETRELMPHSPKYFFNYCVPIEYDKDATCHEWMAFLDRIFPENGEFKIITSQIFGYILYGGDQWLHKAFVLYGEGRNGKSTFLHILQKLLGKNNFSSVSLSSLNKPFSVVNLVGKLANITGETPSDKINAEIFKEATSGGMLTGAKKFQDEFDFECNTRFIFACNEMPKFGENTIGMQERLYFIPFKQYFDKKERNGSIKLTLEKEMSGILNWALSGLEILLDERYLPETEASNQLMDDYNCENDSVYAWAKENIELSLDLTHRVKTGYLYNIYKSSISETGRHCVSDQTFYKRLRKFLKSLPSYIDNERYDKNNKLYRGLIVSSNNRLDQLSVFKLPVNRKDIYQ